MLGLSPKDELDLRVVHQAMVQRGVMFSSITLIIWDVFENIFDDTRLFTAHRVQVPSIVYSLARISTLVFLAFALAVGGWEGIYQGWAAVSILAIQRASTSILFYLRVHAFYRSNRWVQAFFLIVCLGLIVSCIIIPYVSGLCSLVFDIGILVALVVHIKPGRRQGAGERFWSPFRIRSEAQIADSILQDSLFYAVIAVVIKVPQIVLLTPAGTGYWEMHSMFIDAAIMCILSAKIFRDMKLGHWMQTTNSQAVSGSSGTRFASDLNFHHGTLDTKDDV
ncbi:hypothetical protein CPB83DRAFT_839335 [Crepidotus variabilis]|uniref:Uncharacterized protein n=1 Tax=Crepidotus variabilis TaxID=179855 RepID=A0A9P6E7B6_9AGAR|nr:hypothetical protein CPB83DRAFT_839335 [Crepidotus variabilis]